MRLAAYERLKAMCARPARHTPSPDPPDGQAGEENDEESHSEEALRQEDECSQGTGE